LILGGEAAFKGGGFVFNVEDMLDWSRESCWSLKERSDR
jgi:hypothetical protein